MKITKDQIRKLQTLKRKVGWLCEDRSAWEGFLTSCAGRLATSSTELSVREGIKVIDELMKQTGQAPPDVGFEVSGRPTVVGRPTAVGRPHNFEDEDKSKQLKYIEYLLAGRPWAYADALARRICKVEKLAWVRSGDLRKIIAALEYDRKRKAKGIEPLKSLSH